MGRPRERAGGGGTVRWLVSAFLRKHGLNGANPRDRTVQKQRMVDAWAHVRRVQQDPVALADAKRVGAAATRARALGGSSFGVAPCKRKARGVGCIEAKWQREVRQCFGLPASAAAVALAPHDSSRASSLATLQLHRVTAPGWGSLAALRAEARDEQAQEAEHEEVVAKWSLGRSNAVLPGVELPNASHLPLEGFAFCEIVAPAIDIAGRAFENADVNKFSSAGREAHKVIAAWDARHCTFKHDAAPRFCAPPKSVSSLRGGSKCYDVGFCVCQKFKSPPPLAQQLAWFLKGQVGKGCRCKSVYESCGLIIRLISSVMGEEDKEASLIAHVGFGNLNSLLFTVMELKQDELDLGPALSADAFLLRCGGLKAWNLSDCLRYCDVASDWHVQLLWVDTRSTLVLPMPFTPQFVLARPFSPDIIEPIWPLPEKLTRLPIQFDSGAGGRRGAQQRPARARRSQPDGNAAQQPAPAAVQDADHDEDVGALGDADDLWGEDGDGTDEEVPDQQDVDVGGGGVDAAPEPRSAAAADVQVRLGRGEALWGQFGPHPIIKLRDGFSVWCSRHSNVTDSYRCKADISGSSLSDEEKLLRLKRWCIKGYQVDPEELQGRESHMQYGPCRRCTDLLTLEELAASGNLFTDEELLGL